MEASFTQIVELVREAGKQLINKKERLKTLNIREKSPNQWVSEVDEDTEKFLVQGILNSYPEATFITEEDTVKQTETGEWCFIIDPLDGTTNYLHGLDIYSISIGITHNGKLAGGIIFVPERNEMFTAWEGAGAFLNGQKIQVSSTERLSNSLLATGFPYYDFAGKEAYLRVLDYFMQNSRGLRRMGSAAIDLAYVACGRFCGFFELHLHPWDVAAGILIVREAGGKAGTFAGDENDYSGAEILASNGKLHSELQDALQHEFRNR